MRQGALCRPWSRPPSPHLCPALFPQAIKAMVANSAGNDTVIFSTKLLEINRKGKSQNRVLLITNRHLLNLMPDNYSKCNRCFQIRQVHHVTVSQVAKEFVVHVAP